MVIRYNKSYRNYLLIFAAISLAVIILLRVTVYDSWLPALVDGVSGWSILAFCMSMTAMAINAYPTQVGILYYAMGIGVVCGIGAYYTDDFIQDWLREIPGVRKTGFNELHIRLVLCIASTVCLAVYTAMKKRVDELEERFRMQADADMLLREAELFKLRQQLQPHFLFNSLNSINALVILAPDKAQDMIGRLSDFLRTSVRRDMQKLVSVTDEMVYLQSYLAIEAVRFGDRLQVNIVRKYETEAVLPPFLLQPLLENAIKFGLYGQTGKVDINMEIVFSGPFLHIVISNPYDETMAPGRKGTGFGLNGIRRRLYLLYARTDLLETGTENGRFTASLKIPQINL